MKEDNLNENKPETGLNQDKSSRRGFVNKVVKGVLAAGLFIGTGSTSQAATQPVEASFCLHCNPSECYSACQNCQTGCQVACQEACQLACQTSCDTKCDGCMSPCDTGCLGCQVCADNLSDVNRG